MSITKETVNKGTETILAITTFSVKTFSVNKDFTGFGDKTIVYLLHELYKKTPHVCSWALFVE